MEKIINRDEQMNKITLELFESDIQHLYDTLSISFYHEQSDRFEILEGNAENIGDDIEGTFLFINGQQNLAAYILYRYYQKSHKTVLLWDKEGGGTDHACYCVYIDKKVC